MLNTLVSVVAFFFVSEAWRRVQCYVGFIHLGSFKCVLVNGNWFEACSVDMWLDLHYFSEGFNFGIKEPFSIRRGKL